MKNIIKSAVFIALIAMVSGCSKDKVSVASSGLNAKAKQLNSGRVKVSSIYPTSGINYTAVTVTGSNFDTVLANNKVDINGAYAQVDSVTSTKLIFTLTPANTSGKVTITSGGKKAVVPTNFNRVYYEDGSSIEQQTYPQTTGLAFKDGILYALQDNNGYPGLTSNALHIHQSIFKIVNHKPKVIYTTPSDSTFGQTIIPTTIRHELNGFAMDSLGNLYTCFTRLYFPFGQRQTHVTTILKITPEGKVTVHASKVDTVINVNIVGMVIDPAGNIFVAINYNSIGVNNEIKKITSNGFVSSFYSTKRIINCIATDKSGVVYANENMDVEKFTSNGVPIYIYRLLPYPCTSIFMDLYGNLIAISTQYPGENFLINRVGYVTTYNIQPDPGYGFFTDNLGNLYNLGIYSIHRYFAKQF